MKKLMLGNEAVARGLLEAGCSVVSSYPGTPSTEITEFAAKYDGIYCEWAPNEKVACEVAFGASLSGSRAACCMKHVGLNVAADPLFTLSYTGVGGGLVVCVADDPGMHSSQNEQDSRHYAIAAKLPMVEPSDSAEAKDFVKVAFELSEKYDTPVIFRTCTRIAHSQCAVELEEPLAPVKKEYVKNPQKYIMAPANAIRKHPVVEARSAALVEYAETCALNRVEMVAGSELGIITSGTCYQYVKELYGDRNGCEICSRNVAEMTDRKGITFPILRELPHRNIVLNSLPTNMSDRQDELERAIILDRHFIFTVESADEVDRVVECFKKKLPLPEKVRRI